jgi:hypothetical protein
MLEVELAAAEHLLSSFSSPFFGAKLLYDYGFRGVDLKFAGGWGGGAFEGQ